VPKEKELVEGLRERVHQHTLVTPNLSESIAVVPVHKGNTEVNFVRFVVLILSFSLH
jgi:hypothetical protein